MPGCICDRFTSDFPCSIEEIKDSVNIGSNKLMISTEVFFFVLKNFVKKTKNKSMLYSCELPQKHNSVNM